MPIVPAKLLKQVIDILIDDLEGREAEIGEGRTLAELRAKGLTGPSTSFNQSSTSMSNQ
ncbi:hypothetical protein [Pseudomonas sp. TMP25]|uniref:hypothetical protein n=1 Tax=Pseudomonas sp. TMP25 TaxID=3136561 RepID=UPI0031019D5D